MGRKHRKYDLIIADTVIFYSCMFSEINHAFTVWCCRISNAPQHRNLSNMVSSICLVLILSVECTPVAIIERSVCVCIEFAVKGGVVLSGT